MWPELLSLWGVKITIMGVVSAILFVLTSFVIWRHMREDYAEDDILSLTVIVAVLAAVSLGAWRWWSVGGVLLLPLLGLWLYCRRRKWNWWEWLDALGPPSLIIGAVASLAWGPDLIGNSLALVVGWAVLKLVSRKYRSLRWYKSGKVGFVGIVSVAWWMAAWMVIANWHTSNL